MLIIDKDPDQLMNPQEKSRQQIIDETVKMLPMLKKLYEKNKNAGYGPDDLMEVAHVLDENESAILCALMKKEKIPCLIKEVSPYGDENRTDRRHFKIAFHASHYKKVDELIQNALFAPSASSQNEEKEQTVRYKEGYRFEFDEQFSEIGHRLILAGVIPETSKDWEGKKELLIDAQQAPVFLRVCQEMKAEAGMEERAELIHEKEGKMLEEDRSFTLDEAEKEVKE
jgi:hypothetical protein